MDLLKNVVTELETEVKKSADPVETAKIHALTELLKVLTYSYVLKGSNNSDVSFNYNLIEKAIK